MVGGKERMVQLLPSPSLHFLMLIDLLMFLVLEQTSRVMLEKEGGWIWQSVLPFLLSFTSW